MLRHKTKLGRGVGVAWAWRGRGLGVAWAWLGRGVGVAWAWRGLRTWSCYCEDLWGVFQAPWPTCYGVNDTDYHHHQQQNNKPRCYPQQRFGISFRYSLNEKILKNSQACPLYMFHSSSARNLSTFEAAIGLRWRSNNYLAWAIILRLVQKVAHARGEVARYFCNIRNLRNTKKTR